MALDIYSPVFMAGVIKELPDLYTFAKDRYFGTGQTVFATEKVIIDYDDGAGNLLAPFVIPRVGNVPMMREGYSTFELTPPYIAPSRPLSIDDLLKRRAGESIVSTMTPEQRERLFLADDLKELDDAITRTEEWMCINTMLDNACVMKHIGDNAEKSIDMTAQYYEGSDNPGVFKPTEEWDVGTEDKAGTWYTGVVEQVRSMTAAGRTVTDLVVGTETAEIILNDPWLKKILDNRRIEIGLIDPRWQPSGVTTLGALNFGGVLLQMFCYSGTYEERTIEKRNAKPKRVAKNYFPEKGALLAAPNTGKLLYGAVTQIESDRQTHTRTGTRIPKHNVDEKHNLKETILTSRPLAAPLMKSPWRACRDITQTS